jgi:DNA-binding LacI/PurR family transcriptional regulator
MASFATLREVAELAGVSIGTASQALNKRPNVSPGTRARVIDAATALGYQVKDPLNGSCESALSVIGLLTKHDYGLEVTVNPFYSHVERGVESECRKRNISLMFSSIEVDHQNRPVMWPAMLNEQRIDGLLLVGTFIEDTIDLIQRRINIPIVLVDSYAPHMPFDSVVIDNTQGAATAVHYLLNLGHRNIGLIGSNEESPPGVYERRYSYRKILQELGATIYIEDSELRRMSAYEATQCLLRRCPQITAIFSVNDDTAIGVMNAARDMGLEVPDDLSVVGFDNIDLAKEIVPALTTVHVHKSWLGILGVRHLLERAQNPDQPKITTVVTTQLVVRDSVHSTQNLVTP